MSFSPRGELETNVTFISLSVILFYIEICIQKVPFLGKNSQKLLKSFLDFRRKLLKNFHQSFLLEKHQEKLIKVH